MNRQQIIPALLSALAVVACAYGVLLHATAAMPYQDPTPELLESQEQQLRSAGSLILVAAVVAVASGIWLRRLRAVRK